MITTQRRIIVCVTAFTYAVILCVSCSPQTVFQHDTMANTSSTNNSLSHTGIEGIFQYTIIAEEVRIDYVTPSDGEITIPKEIHNVVVTEIGTSAFYQNRCTSVELPSTIRSIQSAAFYRCDDIKEITIPGETVFIDGNPFFRCSGLSYIH